MFYTLGRALQILGMVLLPVGIAGNVVRPDMVGVKESLTITVVGIGVFVLGWLLQRGGKPK